MNKGITFLLLGVLMMGSVSAAENAPKSIKPGWNKLSRSPMKTEVTNDDATNENSDQAQVTKGPVVVGRIEGEFTNSDTRPKEQLQIKPVVAVEDEKLKEGATAVVEGSYVYDGNLLQYTKEGLMHAMYLTPEEMSRGKITYWPDYVATLNWDAHKYGEIKSVEIHAWNTKVNISEEDLKNVDGRLSVYNQVNGYVMPTKLLQVEETGVGHYKFAPTAEKEFFYVWLELQTADGQVIRSNILKF